MTSRPPMAVPQRQPQRTLSGSGLSQSPTHQRTLSQQYLPQSPIRKSESFSEQSSDVGDVSQSRYNTVPRRGGSRLKLELANDGIEHPGFSESPQNLDALSANKAFTPSRIMSMNDVSDAGDTTPRTSRCQTADDDSVPLPMPPRRIRLVVPAKRPAESSTTTNTPKKDARPKPFVLETPSIAPRYPNTGKAEPSGIADFYPWTGNHPEDQFSDSIIRHGFFDKAPAQSTQEPASAKAPLFPALKHKSGLHTLSTIFTSILNQRRHSGQINSASTFKPPPRVTLTDTKREIWLKDLANPAISLRRLSRTIPHGIRGKVLLEQCLNKNVPTDRAVWLAKCVGANEIRAFKRKGVNGIFVMGGEAKWIRDWTVFVEQFVEAVTNAFNDSNWKTKVTYAIRLATHLYAEHLLDRDHYMEWLVSGLENSNQAKLPMWLLIIQIYWKDLLKLRRHGRRLVHAVLSHHSSILYHPDREILLPLSTRLQSLVESLLLASPENFVNPATWLKFRDSLLEHTRSSNTECRSRAFKSIDLRNDYLTSSNAKSQPALRSIVVQMLDNIQRAPLNTTIPKQLWKTSENKPSIVRTILEWSTSLYRPGIAKIYIAAALLRSSSELDVDVTRSVLDFLDSDPLEETARKQLVYHLVSELSRSSHFSVPLYIQWLIARGGILNPVEAARDGPCATRLLVEIPLHCLSESMKNLRGTLLRRGSFSVDDEARDMALAISCVKSILSVPLDPSDPLFNKKPMSLKKLTKRIDLSSRSLKTTIASWLSNDFITESTEIFSSGSGVELPKPAFETVRTLLEAAEDYTMLENVLKSMAAYSNAELLACCVDTVNLHLPVFTSTGSAKSLFEIYYERLKTIIEEQGVGTRPLLASLANLAPRLAGIEEAAAQLQNDLIRIDRSSAADASSPLSDNMATQLQDAETELSEQIEKLASYTSADRPTMERLFYAIVKKLQTYWGKDDERQRLCCILLTRLRVFDIQHFNELMKIWVQHLRKLTNRPYIAQLFPPLISSGCLSLAILFATAARNQNQVSQSQPTGVGFASIYQQEVLQMLMMPFSPSPVMTSEDCYRFRIIQDHAKRDHARDLMPLIRGALAEYSASHNQQASIPQPLEDEQTEATLLELIRDLVLVDPSAASQIVSLKGPDPKLAALIETWTTKLLVPDGGGGQKSFEQVLELANEFTLPFCQVKLSLNLATDELGGVEGSERIQSQFEQLSKALDNAIDANNIMWTGMLPSLSPDITQHMRNRAESRFLEIIPSLKNPPEDALFHKDIHMAENLLTVIDSIFRGGSGSKVSPLSSSLVDKLADLWDILASKADEYALLKNAVLSHWLPLIFSYLTLYTSPSAGAVDVSKLTGGEIRGRALIVLAGLVQELDNYPTFNLGRKAFDIALALVDGLPEEARLQCVRAVKDATADPRIRYLFSFAPNPAEDFMLAHRDKPLLGPNERRAMAMGMGASMIPERLTPFVIRRWEILNEPTPNVGENDTSLSLTLFDARKIK